MNLKQKLIGGLLALVAVLGGGNALMNLGSVGQGGEYHATSSANGAIPNWSVFCSDVGGTLGSISFTTSGVSVGGSLKIHNASSSYATPGVATDTKMWISAAATTTDWHKNMIMTRGILLEQIGSIGTTTITYRCNA